MAKECDTSVCAFNVTIALLLIVLKQIRKARQQVSNKTDKIYLFERFEI